MRRSLPLVCSFIAALLFAAATHAADPLPSWNKSSSKQAIVAFVQKVTKTGGEHFVAADERIAVFDNDGTLWSEQPMYTQMAFALDRIKTMAPAHPEWQRMPPFKAVIDNDIKAFTATGEKGVAEVLMASHTGMTTDEFAAQVRDWIATAKHPKTGKFYTEMVYQPMLELLDYFRANGFKTFIVSGGGIEFMRPWTQQVYGIPPEQVIGSSVKTQFEMRDGVPVLVRLPELNFNDDKAGKPVGINQAIGRRPIAAFGNSDGDIQMLQWVTAGREPTLGMFVHHTDAKREVAYDRDSMMGRLNQGLELAPATGWTLIDMQNDWKTIFPHSK